MLAFIGRHWPALAFVDLRWLLWAGVGCRGDLWAVVGFGRPSFVLVGLRWPDELNILVYIISKNNKIKNKNIPGPKRRVASFRLPATPVMDPRWPALVFVGGDGCRGLLQACVGVRVLL